MDVWTRFEGIIKQYKRMAVALSGGVDSTLLCQLASEILGPENVLALTAVSVFQGKKEITAARDTVSRLGIRHVLVEMDVLADDVIAANPVKRCYFCKKAIFTKLMEQAKLLGFDVLADGTNLSDRGDFRPGRKALAELKIISPFDLAGVSKDDIRKKAREIGMACWNMPAAACLASRIPYGTIITSDLLLMVEQAEDELEELGFVGGRVRHHGDIARIELKTPEEMERAVRLAAEINTAFKKIGFRYVALDLGGYRMGSLNEGKRAD